MWVFQGYLHLLKSWSQARKTVKPKNKSRRMLARWTLMSQLIARKICATLCKKQSSRCWLKWQNELWRIAAQLKFCLWAELGAMSDCKRWCKLWPAKEVVQFARWTTDIASTMERWSHGPASYNTSARVSRRWNWKTQHSLSALEPMKLRWLGETTECILIH